MAASFLMETSTKAIAFGRVCVNIIQPKTCPDARDMVERDKAARRGRGSGWELEV
jgi:hypothetical protein